MIELREWYDNNKPFYRYRHLELTARLLVVPYFRMTRTTRYAPTSRGKRAREYTAFVGGLREAICNLMRIQGLGPFGASNIGARFRVNIADRGRYRRQDLSNQVKALEDACNSALWIDDKWIVELHAEKHLATEDRFVVDAWEIG